MHGLSSNFDIHVSVSDLYISTIGPLIVLQENRQGQSWENINLSQKRECRNWDCGTTVPFLGIFVSIFGTVALQCLKMLRKGGAVTGWEPYSLHVNKGLVG